MGNTRKFRWQAPILRPGATVVRLSGMSRRLHAAFDHSVASDRVAVKTSLGHAPADHHRTFQARSGVRRHWDIVLFAHPRMAAYAQAGTLFRVRRSGSRPQRQKRSRRRVRRSADPLSYAGGIRYLGTPRCLPANQGNSGRTAPPASANPESSRCVGQNQYVARGIASASAVHRVLPDTAFPVAHCSGVFDVRKCPRRLRPRGAASCQPGSCARCFAKMRVGLLLGARPHHADGNAAGTVSSGHRLFFA